MAKKKKQFPNKKRNNIMAIAVLLAVVILVGVGCGAYYFWDRNEMSFIATIDGERVSAGEYRLNLLQLQLQYQQSFGPDIWFMQIAEGFSIKDMVKEEAFTMTISSYLSTMMAREHGADFLTFEQEQAIQSELDWLHLFLGPEVIRYIGLSDAELHTALSRAMHAENLFMMVTDDIFVFDEEAFEVEFAAYFEEQGHLFARYAFYYIFTDSAEDIQAAMALLEAGEEFFDVMAEFSIDFVPPRPPAEVSEEDDEEDESEDESEDEPEEDADDDENEDGMFTIEVPINLNRIEVFGDELGDDVDFIIFALEPGEFSGIVPLFNEWGGTDGYVIIKLLEIVEADYEFERMRFREEFFIPRGRNEIFVPIFEEFVEGMDIRRNDRTFDRIAMFGF